MKSLELIPCDFPCHARSGTTRIDNAQGLSVANQLVLQNANSAGDQQGAMYGDPAGSWAFTVLYDNVLSPAAAKDRKNSVVSGFAVANPDSKNSVTVMVVAYENAGNILASDASVTLKPLGHRAFLFSEIPALAPWFGRQDAAIFGSTPSRMPLPPLPSPASTACC